MNVIFDLDGTLTDPWQGITRCIQHALSKMGAPVPASDALLWCIGPPLRASLATLMPDRQDADIDQALTLYRERFQTTGMFENQVYEGIPELLTRLTDQKHQLLVATAKPRIFAISILAHFGLAHFFSQIFGSELDGRLSDKESLLAHVLEQAPADARDSVMIGDRVHDVRGAQANGIACFAVTWGYGSPGELTGAGAARLCANPEQLGQAVIERADLRRSETAKEIDR